MKIAVVRNRNNNCIVNEFGPPCPESYGKRSVQMIMDSLRWGGHKVKAFEGDGSLITRLRKFMPPGKKTGRPTGLVFNLAYGIQGDCRYTHVPAMLEMAGVPYTGATPYGHVLSLDKVLAKTLMREHGIRTPNFRVIADPDEDPGDLRFPLVVKPRHESTSYGLRLVHTREELSEAVGFIVGEYTQGALVEEYIDGREVHVGLLGNDPVETFPLVEYEFGARVGRLMMWEDKYHRSEDEPLKVCPAPVDAGLGQRMREMAVSLFHLVGCRDYARVDMRLDEKGEPYVLEINSMASLGRGGAYVMSARVAGYSFESLICRIVDLAHQRYFGAPAKRTRSSADAMLMEALPEELARRVETWEEDPAQPKIEPWWTEVAVNPAAVELLPTQDNEHGLWTNDTDIRLPELHIQGEAA
jgi:D-alanine-D-alanine ligase